MDKGRTAEAYARLPVFAQNVMCNLYGAQQRRTRFGRDFRSRYEWLLETEGAGEAEIAAYRDEQVAALVRHAYETVPYYRRVMDERGLRPGDVTCVKDLGKLPVLRKEDVVANWAEIRSRTTAPGDLRIGHTNGTTGTSLRFYTSTEAIAFQWAVWWRHRARFGVAPMTWHVNFTTRPAVPLTQRRSPYWRWVLPMRQALVTAQTLRKENVAAVAAFVDAHAFPFFTGYPSCVHSFCLLLEDAGLSLASPPRHVFLGAEETQAHQLESIERVTGAHVSDQYGFAEGCGNASRCEHDVYHEDWEFGVLECSDPEPRPDGSVRGRVLATGFANRAFPFIRYDVGDSALWAPAGTRCACGRRSAAIRRIEGRNEDYVVTPEGGRFMRLDHLWSQMHGMKEVQAVQREREVVLIRYVPRASFRPDDEALIRERARSWLSPSMRIEFEQVDEIPRGPGGKFKQIVCELADADAREAE